MMNRITAAQTKNNSDGANDPGDMAIEEVLVAIIGVTTGIAPVTDGLPTVGIMVGAIVD